MRELRWRDRVRLIAALAVLAALSLLSAIGIGAALHGRSETIDSLEHWQARLEAGDSRPEDGFDSPAVRVRRLQTELDAVPERLLALISVFVLTAVLLVLGLRALRRAPRGGS
jgi:hypothetical protein